MELIRPLAPADHAALVDLWHQGWHEAHAHLVPAGILSYRTVEHFSIWLNECHESFFVFVDDKGIQGFVSVEGAELVKLYVNSVSRGVGIAHRLLTYGETLLAQRGIKMAQLFCTAGNVRAHKFYSREGWHLAETFSASLWLPMATQSENFQVQTHRFTKELDPLMHCD